MITATISGNRAMLPVRLLLGSALLLSLLAASVADAMPPLAEGDLVGFDSGALRRLEGLPSSENVFSGFALSLRQSGGNPNYCSSGLFDVESDGDVIAWDGLRNVLVHIDLDTDAWHVLSGLGVGIGPTLMAADPVIEPSGSLLMLELKELPVIVRVDLMTGDRSVFLEAPVPPSQPGQFAEFNPRAIAVRPGGTIAMYSVVSSTGVTQARLFDVDPETAARTPLTYLDAAIATIDLAANESGDALLLSSDRIRAVDAVGTVRTLSGNGVGTGPALAATRAFATNGTDSIYATQAVASAEDDLLAIDPTTGDRELVPNPKPPQQPRDFAIDDLAIAPDGSLLGIGCGPELIRIDPETGMHEIAFDPLIGVGPPFGYGPIAIDRRGRPVVGAYQEIMRVEPTSGERLVLSSSAIGTGPALATVTAIDVGPTGDLFAIPGACSMQILRIDPTTGNRTVVSQNGIEPPYWFCPKALAAADDGFLYVSDLGALHRLDPSTGARAILSDATHGAGPLWSSLALLQKGPVGTLLGVGGAVFYQVDLATGDRSVFFDANPLLVDFGGSGLAVITGFAVDGNGRLAIVVESTIAAPGALPNHLFRVDPTSGDIIEDSLGFFGPIAAVPEPAPALLAIVAVAALAARTTRRGRL
jgi:hypothetical protein